MSGFEYSRNWASSEIARRAAILAMPLKRGYTAASFAKPDRANAYYARQTVFGPSIDWWDGKLWWRCTKLGNNKQLPKVVHANQQLPWRELTESERIK